MNNYIHINKDNNSEQLIEDIKYTIDLNKKELLDLLSKNRTRNMTISFDIRPDEIVTMGIFCSKMVMTKKDYLA